MENSFLYQVDDKTYPVLITYKRIKNIHYRFNGEVFLISCPKRVAISMIKSGLDKYARKLINRDVKSSAIGKDFIYIFGQKYDLTYPGLINVNGLIIKYKDEKELQRKLKRMFFDFVSNRTIFYERVMACPHYLIKVRQMKSRYGSNNRSKMTITYSLVLLHYSQEIINSVIIHELAHHFVYDHSDKFYKVVYKYCPDYDILRKKLIKAELN